MSYKEKKKTSRPFCQASEAAEQRGSRRAHTKPGPGLIFGDHCTDPEQIRCQSTKLPSFPLVVAEWEQRYPAPGLRTAGAKR